MDLDIKKEVLLLKDYIISMRRYFHQIPEIGMEEWETSKKIKEELRKMDIPYQEIAKTGVIGTIGNGSKTVALRADMDALKIVERTGLSYASQHEGFMHACGHDGHMAALLGAAKVLKAHEKDLNITVKLLFQPAEECVAGARKMLEEDCLEEVDEVFGIHIFSDIPSGKVSLEPGPRMASTNQVTITVEGRPGHAGKPHQCVDATVVAAQILINLQSIVSRFLDPIDSAVVSFGSFHSGTLRNIISGKAILEGTVRTFSRETASFIGEKIKEVAINIGNAYGARVDVDFQLDAHPAVINDDKIAKIAELGARMVLPETSFISVPKMMLGEDFSLYLQKVPGVFAFVGCGNEEKGCIYPNHHDKFMIDEDSLLIATMLHLAYVWKTME